MERFVMGTEIFSALELVSSFIPTPIYWEDINSIIIGANQHVLTAVGLDSLSDYIGKSLYDLYPKEMADSIKNHNDEVMRTKKILSQEEVIADARTGELKYFTAVKAPLYNKEGVVIGIIGTSVNITELRKTQEGLHIAREKSEAANRAKTEFLANMSHDVKTPLTGVVTMADIMVHDNSARDVDRERAQIIFSSGQQIVSLFNSCLDLSKMEMEEWAAKTVVFSVKQLLDDIHALFAPKALANHLSLQMECDAALPKAVEGHRESLYRVLLNLVGNALKFTEQGGVIVRVFNIQQTDDPHVTIEFHVQDTGLGIPEDQHAVIFEKLKRLTPSYASKIEGSGMGLYIVDQYVKRMGGEIQVQSQVGQGSTFIVSLPFKIVSDITFSPTPIISMSVNNQARPLPVNLDSPAPQEDRHSESLPRVLLVEDTEMIQFVTKSLLQNAGFAVDIASSGEAALELFSPEKYSLVYMDIGLPVMNGYETSRAIRAKEKALNAPLKTPIIALTGHGAMDVQAFCRDAGMQGVLSKPLSREQAEKVWQRYGQQKSIPVPGLTILENNQPVVSENNTLDIAATLKLVGPKEIADKLISEFVKDLENQFLPNIQALIAEHNCDGLKFLLHQKLGSLAYVKAPLLEKKLSDLQTALYNGLAITQDVYMDIEQAVLCLVQCYKKTKITG